MSTANQADLLVRNIDWLITVGPDRRIIRDAALAVKNGKFAAIGKTAAIEPAWRADRVVDGKGAVVMPGMIDNHLHSSFQLARGLADEANAQSFLFEHMYPYEAVMREDDVYTSVTLAAIEMLRHGVTCYIEPGNYYPDATVRAVMGAGMRMVLAVSCFDRNKAVTGLMPESMIDNTERRLKPGFFAHAAVLTQVDPNALTVPQQALVTFAGVSKVYVIENEVARERVVQTGVRVGTNEIEITTGLKPGELVAISGLTRLIDGAAVAVSGPVMPRAKPEGANEPR